MNTARLNIINKKLLQNAATVALVVSAAGCGVQHRAEADTLPARYVNPFIGASTNIDAAGAYHGLGKTFPGATTPYGMVQVNPNTITGGDNGSGYSYEHTTIEGFAMTQMSGIGWFGEMGNFLVMPTTGELKKVAGKEDGRMAGYRSTIDKSSEKASAGYYSVRLSDYDITVEGTATPRCGMLRFTYPEHAQSRIQIDLARRVGGSSDEQYIKVVDENTIEGWMRCTPECGGWGNGDGNANYTVHYYATFSHPLKNYGIWSAEIPDGFVRKRDEVDSMPYMQLVASAPVMTGVSEITGKNLGFYTEFATRKGETVEMKVAISYVDIEGARKNYEAEIKDKTFDEVVSQATDLWNRALSKVKVEGGDDDRRTVFYTALYHTMIDPRVITDVDGRYYGGDFKVHTGDGTFTKRTIFSGWDVYRSQFPLQCIINPQLVSDQINSLITLAQESGREYFERWELLNAYSGCMLGNPAMPVIADAWVKGIRTYDASKALTYGINSEEKFGNGEKGYTPGSVSHTLEYAYADWCLAQFARQLGETSVADKYEQKAQAYRNVFNSEAGWYMPRKADGSWPALEEGFRMKEGLGCMECNLYQQGWFVPHDVEGMVQLMGGKEKALADLKQLFEKMPADMLWNQYYNHANEPVHFVPFLFNKLGEPWETQKWTRYICANGYKNKVEGLVGNEDVGQMSAWYVLAAAGLHPSCPGETRMEITSPMFDRIEFALDKRYASGERFEVVTHNNSAKNVYIERALLNGKEYGKCYIDFDEIKKGGKLELFMTDTPCKTWGTESADKE